MHTAKALRPVDVEVPPVTVAMVEAQCGSDPAAIAPAMKRAFDQLLERMQKSRLAASGPPRTIYTVASAQETRFAVASPILREPAAAEAPLEITELPGGGFLRFEHHGPYSGLVQTYEEITAWMIANGLMKSRLDWDRYMPMWEEYPTDPAMAPPERLLTYIYIPKYATAGEPSRQAHA